MKKLLLVLLLLSTSSFVSAQDLVWRSYTEPDGDLSYSLSFYSDGSVFTQGIDYSYLRDAKYMDLLEGISGIRKFVDDIKTVQKKKQPILNEKYSISKGSFGSAEVKLQNVPRTYTFTKYAIKLFEKELKKFEK